MAFELTDKQIIEFREFESKRVDKVINNYKYYKPSANTDFISEITSNTVCNDVRKPISLDGVEILYFDGVNSFVKHYYERLFELYCDSSRLISNVGDNKGFYFYNNIVIPDKIHIETMNIFGNSPRLFLDAITNDRLRNLNNKLRGEHVFEIVNVFDSARLLTLAAFNDLTSESFQNEIEHNSKFDGNRKYKKFKELMISQFMYVRSHLTTYSSSSFFRHENLHYSTIVKFIDNNFTDEQLREMTREYLNDEEFESAMRNKELALKAYDVTEKLLNAGLTSALIHLPNNKKELVLIRLPSKIEIDESNILSSAKQPVIKWRDGTEIYALNNVYFNKQMWQKVVNKSISKAEIDELSKDITANTERIGVIFSTIGYDRVIRLFPSKLVKTYVEKDDKGRELHYELYECDLPDEITFNRFTSYRHSGGDTDEYRKELEEKIYHMVSLTSRLISVEWFIKDGTKEEAYIRVPPKELEFLRVLNDNDEIIVTKNSDDIKALLAWTFYKKPEEYNPVIQT